MRKRVMFGFVTAALAAVFLSPVQASAQGRFYQVPSPVEVGTVITVTVQCGGALPPVAIESPAFSVPLVLGPTGDNGGNVVYSGSVKVIDEPGTYPVTARCARGINLGDSSITLTPAGSLAPVLTLEPTTLKPGGTIRTSVPLGACRDQGEAIGPIESEGFVARIEHELDPARSAHVGTGQVVDRPGTYTARAHCGKGEVSATFTIVAADPAPAPNPQPKPKPQVKVKPAGAPQTGGGGTA